MPSECARLLHAHAIDVGLIPSIEYLRGPRPYAFVPGPAITSRGPVASVALYTRVEPRDVRSIAMDTSSRTSVALATVLLRARVRHRRRTRCRWRPDLDAMLARADAALIIGDNALFLDHRSAIRNPQSAIRKIDLGELWTASTGLPFVYAFWAGRPGRADARTTSACCSGRGTRASRTSDDVARAYFPDDPAGRLWRALPAR